MAHSLEVVFAPEADNDLKARYDFLSERAPAERAFAFVEGLRRHLLGFADFPERGTRRDAVRPGLRTVGYRRRVTVAFAVRDREVLVLRVFYAGRDVDAALRASTCP